MTNHIDNEWYAMGTWEKIFTWVRIIVMLIIGNLKIILLKLSIQQPKKLQLGWKKTQKY